VHVRGSVVVEEKLGLAKKTFMHKYQYEKSKLLGTARIFNFCSHVDSV